VRRSPAAGDRRQLQRLALPGTPWETPVYINRSGAPGPSVMVLGGVHGNEPGGWLAASEIAQWMPDQGLTVVVPRANIVATEALERTLPELGDLNRFYPGVPPESANAFPMQWMAYSIVELAREFEVGLLLDLHESWGFFNERTADGTAFLGQTVTNGASVSETPRIEAVTSAVNELISDREQLVLRDRNRNRFTNFTQRPNFDPSWPTGGTSSLGLDEFVPGLVPVLVEMGQQNQPESRRVELHQLVVEQALRHEGLLTA
jgi:predicted deacylase